MSNTPIIAQGELIASKGGPMLVCDADAGGGSYVLIGLQDEGKYIGQKVKVVGIPEKQSGSEDDLRDSTGAYRQGRAGEWTTLQVQTIEVLKN